ncbi:MAG: PD40 domain-containing protein [Armatimonadetes bacterium]|nr:PD40 domain-containing protein [Armatimonadota bacterium]
MIEQHGKKERWVGVVALVVAVVSLASTMGGCKRASTVESVSQVRANDAVSTTQLIIFITWIDGNDEIYVMDESGANQRNLTNNAADDTMPRWSSASGKIAFVSKRDGSADVFVMNTDGSDVVNLTNNPAWDSNHSWSPDGKNIAFVSFRDGNREIYVVAPTGGEQKRLTDWRGPDDAIRWFPDSKRMWFSSVKGGKGWTWTMNADGTDKRRLDDTDYFYTGPIVSKDGMQMAFVRNSEEGYEVYVTDQLGADKARLTTAAKSNGFADWTDESLQLLLSSSVNGRGSINSFDIATQRTTVIATFNNSVFAVSLSPDKEKILFAQGGPEGGSEIYVMNADGSDVKQLTSHGLSAGAPSWISVGN